MEFETDRPQESSAEDFQLSEQAAVPLFRQVADMIQGRIVAGELRPHEVLLSTAVGFQAIVAE